MPLLLLDGLGAETRPYQIAYQIFPVKRALAALSAVPLSAANAVLFGLWKSPGPPTLIAIFDCPLQRMTEPKLTATDTVACAPPPPAATSSVRL